jgi:hypothetical protein
MRAGFVLAGLLLLMPFQAAAINAWVNVAGALLGVYIIHPGTERGEIMFVRNAWYVAAWDHEVTRSLKRRVFPGRTCRFF